MSCDALPNMTSILWGQKYSNYISTTEITYNAEDAFYHGLGHHTDLWQCKTLRKDVAFVFSDEAFVFSNLKKNLRVLHNILSLISSLNDLYKTNVTNKAGVDFLCERLLYEHLVLVTWKKPKKVSYSPLSLKKEAIYYRASLTPKLYVKDPLCRQHFVFPNKRPFYLKRSNFGFLKTKKNIRVTREVICTIWKPQTGFVLLKSFFP